MEGEYLVDMANILQMQRDQKAYEQNSHTVSA